MNLLYLSRADVESLQIGLPAIIAVVEEGFRLKGLGQTEMPPKTSLHPHDLTTFLNAMPAYVGGDVKACSMKSGITAAKGNVKPKEGMVLARSWPSSRRPFSSVGGPATFGRGRPEATTSTSSCSLMSWRFWLPAGW